MLSACLSSAPLTPLTPLQDQEDAPRNYRLVPVVDALKTKEAGYITIQEGAKACLVLRRSRPPLFNIDASEDSEGHAAKVAPAASAASPLASAAAEVPDYGEEPRDSPDRLSKVNPLYGKPAALE